MQLEEGVTTRLTVLRSSFNLLTEDGCLIVSRAVVSSQHVLEVGPSKSPVMAADNQ